VNRRGGLSWLNHIDSAVLAASSASTGLPVSNLQTIRLKRVWRSAGDLTISITAAFPAPRPIDVLGLFGCNATESALWRWRLSSTAAHDGDQYDTGVAAMNRALILGARGQAVQVRPAGPVMAAYLKLDLMDSGLPYFQAGLLWAGTLWQPEVNFSYGQAPKVGDDSVTSTSKGGDDYTDVLPQYMTDSFTLPAVTEAEYQDTLLELDRIAGTARNVLWLRTPQDDATRNKTAILGRMTALAPSPSVSHNRRSRQFQIKERL